MNHHQLINVAKALGYKSITDAGLCKGFAMMWVQAACVGDMVTFYDRLNKVLSPYKSDPKALVDEIKKIRDKCKKTGYKPTAAEQKILEIPAFFDGIALYLSPQDYPEVFNKSNIQQTNENLIAQFTASKNYGPVKKVFATVDQYDIYMLEKYLSNLATHMGDRKDIAITFSSGNHAVSARYLGNGSFEYIDTNLNQQDSMLPIKVNAKYLAKSLFLSLKRNKQERQIPLISRVFIPSNAPSINLEPCRNIQPIKGVTLAADHNGLTIIDLACWESDLHFMQRLGLKSLESKQIQNMFFKACIIGNEEIVRLLLENGANSNEPYFGSTACDWAIKKGYSAVVAMLLPHTTFSCEKFGKIWSLKKQDSCLDLQKDILIKGVSDYIKQREQEPTYGNILRLGYSKEEKIAAATALLKYLEDPKNELCAEDKKVLKNGRLSNIYTQCLHYQKNLANNPHNAEHSKSYKERLQSAMGMTDQKTPTSTKKFF